MHPPSQCVRSRRSVCVHRLPEPHDSPLCTNTSASPSCLNLAPVPPNLFCLPQLLPRSPSSPSYQYASPNSQDSPLITPKYELLKTHIPLLAGHLTICFAPHRPQLHQARAIHGLSLAELDSGPHRHLGKGFTINRIAFSMFLYLLWT